MLSAYQSACEKIVTEQIEGINMFFVEERDTRKGAFFWVFGTGLPLNFLTSGLARWRLERRRSVIRECLFLWERFILLLPISGDMVIETFSITFTRNGLSFHVSRKMQWSLCLHVDQRQHGMDSVNLENLLWQKTKTKIRSLFKHCL